MTRAELQAENDELRRHLAWRTSSRDKLIEVLTDIVADDKSRRELALGRAMAMINSLREE